MATPASSTLSKGLRLLAAIVADQGRSSLSDIARVHGLPLATAHRLAVTLEDEGFLTRLRKGHFIAGDAAMRMAGAVLPGAALRGPLSRLARQYGAFAHFGVLEDGMVTYLVKERGVEADLFTAERMQQEAYCSAVGKVLLAALPQDELDTYLASGPFVALTRHTLTDPEAIRREIDEVRERGVGFDRCEIRDDLYCMAVPVAGDDGRTFGAVSLSLLGRLPDPAEQRRIIRQLRGVAAGGSVIMR